MRHLTMILMRGAVAASLLAGCSSNPTAPNNGGGGTSLPPSGGTNGGTSQAPATAAVTLGDIFFKSAHNGTSNPAIDTVAINGTVTWTWTGSMSHSVQSMGSPSFISSAIQGSGKTYQFQFTTPGTYQYDCAVHGTLMTGMIVVVDASGSPMAPPSSSAPMPSMPPPSGY